jgi:hypothetical protein
MSRQNSSSSDGTLHTPQPPPNGGPGATDSGIGRFSFNDKSDLPLPKNLFPYRHEVTVLDRDIGDIRQKFDPLMIRTGLDLAQALGIRDEYPDNVMKAYQVYYADKRPFAGFKEAEWKGRPGHTISFQVKALTILSICIWVENPRVSLENLNVSLASENPRVSLENLMQVSSCVTGCVCVRVCICACVRACVCVL